MRPGGVRHSPLAVLGNRGWDGGHGRVLHALKVRASVPGWRRASPDRVAARECRVSEMNGPRGCFVAYHSRGVSLEIAMPHATINGARLWYDMRGPDTSGRAPILLH